MAVLTWIGVNPAVYVFDHAVRAAMGAQPELLTLLTVNLFVVASLTWLIMPLLTRVLTGWIHPS